MIVLAIIIVSYALYKETFNIDDVDVEPIHVPSRLAETGVTAHVAGQHLIDRVHQIHRAVEDHYKPGEMTPLWSKPNLFLPTTNLSIHATARYLRRLFRSNMKRRGISGELIATGRDNYFSLHLRFTGPKGFTAPKPNKKMFTGPLHRIFEQGGRGIVETIDPYALAAYYYSRDEYAMARELSSFIVTNYKGKEAEFLAVNLLGLLDSHEGRYTDAIEKYKRAVALNPKFALVYHNWAYALFAAGKHDDALTKFEMATKLKPSFPDAYYEWGNTFAAKGKHDDAITKYKTATELKPNFPDAYYEWGNALFFNGDYRGAEMMYKKAIEGDPKTYKYLTDTFEGLRTFGRLPQE